MVYTGGGVSHRDAGRDPPEHKLLLLTAPTRSASQLPAAAPPLMSPWQSERCYPLSGAKLFSSMQKMRSCLSSLRTRLKSCSCQKPASSKHFRGESGFLLLIPGSGSDLLGILLPVTKHLHDSVSMLKRSMNLLAQAAGEVE